jgi:hypothetical protein
LTSPTLHRALRAEAAVGAVFAARLLPLLAAPITMWLVATRRPAAEQGFYVIFQNVQALAQLAELGLGALVVQFVAHETSALVWSPNGALHGESQAMDRIARLLHAAFAWYGRAALVLFLAVPLGWLMFDSEARRTGVGVAGPWLSVVAATAAYLLAIPLVCLAEGAGHLLRVQRMRATQAIVAVTALWIGIVALDSLWGMTLFALAWLAVPLAWLIREHRGLLLQALEWVRESAPTTEAAAALAKQYVGVQRRTAASSLALWAAPQSLAAALLVFQGAASAGRAGFSLALASASATLGTAWLFARYPRLGAHVAGGDMVARDELARHSMLQALTACALLGTAVTAAVAALRILAPAIATRALPAGATSALAAASLGWVAIQGWAAWLRAERREPLTLATVAGAVVVVVVTVAGAATSDAATTAGLYSLAVLFAAAPLAAIAFRRARAI